MKYKKVLVDMKNKLLILTLVALTIIGVVIAQNQSLEEELASLEEELVNAGFDWLVNATIDENLDTSTIEVFTQNGNETLAVFENIQEEKFYKIYLTELNGTQDVFDLRINGSVEFDQILDPAPTMATVKINSTTNRSNESIKGYCKATDSDGDNLVYQYQWYNGSTVYFNGTLFKEGTISAGYYHTCGIRASDSRVLCWGNGDYGQLGDGSNATHNVLYPNVTTDNSSYSSISARQSHTCGIRQNDSRVLCWGNGDYGQLGDGSTSAHSVSNPNVTTDSSSYSSMEVGYYHTCGIRVNDSRVLCWGNGTLGDGETTENLNPNVTTDNSSYSSISAGRLHTCGIRANDSRVLCWGESLYGRLGDGQSGVDVLNPNLTTDTSPYKKGFTQGEEVLVSILGNAYIKKGEIWKLGCRAYDFTTYSSWMNSTAMTILSSPPTMATVKINSTTNSSTENIKGYCNATDTDGDDLAYQYQWYNGSTVYFNGTLFKDGSISAGEFHTCGIRANDSRVLCWGGSTEGQLGDGETTTRLVPTLTSDTSTYLRISAGEGTTCGIRANDSRVLCWGDGQYGSLGDGNTSLHNNLNPNLTTDTSAYSSVSVGGAHSCGIRANDSRVLCWGVGTYGRLGDGETTDNPNPNVTTDSFAYTKIIAGPFHTCGIRTNDSRVLCWGDGSYGTLGDGNTAAHNVANPNITTSSSPYKKGFSSSEEVLVSILGNAYLNVGENWSLGCRSYDFTDYSSWMNSSVLTIVPYEPSSGTGFFITNNAGGNVALFDKNGNFYLKGKKNSNQGTLNAPANSFVLQNSSGTTIAYVNSTGSLFARGSISEDSSLTGKTSSNLEFKNSTDNLIGFFDNQGNLKLKGYVVENYFSYILGLFNKMGLFFNQGLLHER